MFTRITGEGEKGNDVSKIIDVYYIEDKIIIHSNEENALLKLKKIDLNKDYSAELEDSGINNPIEKP